MNTFLSRALIIGLIWMLGLAANTQGATTDVAQAGSATTIEVRDGQADDGCRPLSVRRPGSD